MHTCGVLKVIGLASKWNSKLTIIDLLASIIIHPTKSPLDLVMVGRMHYVSMGTTQVQQTQDPMTQEHPPNPCHLQIHCLFTSLMGAIDVTLMLKTRNKRRRKWKR
jgi:hypothetical protein